MGNLYTEGVALAEVKLRRGQQLAAEIGRAARRSSTADYGGNAH